MKITAYELLWLIKDNKAPKNIKVDNKIYNFHKGIETGYALKDDENIMLNFNYYIENNKLNKKDIEILKENENWEKIEKFGVILGGDCKTRYVSLNGVSYEFPQEIADKINQLIKNQKYLKEKLESKDE